MRGFVQGAGPQEVRGAGCLDENLMEPDKNLGQWNMMKDGGMRSLFLGYLSKWLKSMLTYYILIYIYIVYNIWLWQFLFIIKSWDYQPFINDIKTY